MKIALVGISGLLGQELAHSLSADHEVVGITRATSVPGFTVHRTDIAQQDTVYALLSKINADLVVNAAALSDVDRCEREPDAAWQVNALGVRNIALACQRFDTALLHISTDYVFGGRAVPVEGYTEFDRVDPVNAYGRSKLQAERYVSSLLNRFCIVRTSLLFGPSRGSFIGGVAQSLKARQDVTAVTDLTGAPTSVKDLATAVRGLVDRSAAGVYHVTNSGFVSRFDCALAIAAMMGADPRLIKRSTQKKLGLAAMRPVFSGLRNYVLNLEGRKPLRPWQDAVREYLDEQKFI